MTRRDHPELNAYRAIAAAEIRALEVSLFRREGTFSLGVHRWPCRFSVRDVQQMKPDEVAKLQMYAAANNLVYTDLRRVRVHPDDTVPYPGATLEWDDGILEILEWGQQSDFTDMRVGTAVLRRP